MPKLNGYRELDSRSIPAPRYFEGVAGETVLNEAPLAEARNCAMDSFHHEGQEEHEEVKGTAHRTTLTILGPISGYPIRQLNKKIP